MFIERKSQKKKIKYPWGYEINRRNSKRVTLNRGNDVGIYLFTIIGVV